MDSIRIPIGTLRYDLKLHSGLIPLRGQHVLGCCDLDRQLILISDVPKPDKRLAVFWHEVAHAWIGELDSAGSTPLDEERLCNMIGHFMVAWGPRLIGLLQIYLTSGLVAHDIMMLPMGPAIPVVHFYAPKEKSTT